MFLQQGDLLVKQVKSIPGGRKINHLTLAKGEVTGHHHTVTQGDAEIIDAGQKWYLRILSAEAIITHQEHKPIVVPRGEYEIGVVREYDHFAEEARRIQD